MRATRDAFRKFSSECYRSKQKTTCKNKTKKLTQQVMQVQIGCKDVVVGVIGQCTQIFCLVVIRHRDTQRQGFLLLGVVHLQAFQIAGGSCTCENVSKEIQLFRDERCKVCVLVRRLWNGRENRTQQRKTW